MLFEASATQCRGFAVRIGQFLGDVFFQVCKVEELCGMNQYHIPSLSRQMPQIYLCCLSEAFANRTFLAPSPPAFAKVRRSDE